MINSLAYYTDDLMADIHWLRPGVQTETAGKMVGQAWDISKCPMLLAACCLASVGHLDAVQPNRPIGNYEVYKARVLKEISKRMSTSEAAVSNETLSALGCLVSFEVSNLWRDSIFHFLLIPDRCPRVVEKQ